MTLFRIAHLCSLVLFLSQDAVAGGPSSLRRPDRVSVGDIPNQPNWVNKAAPLVVDDGDAILADKVVLSPDGMTMAKGFPLMKRSEHSVDTTGYKVVTYKFVEETREWAPLGADSPVEVHVDNTKFGQSGGVIFDMTMAATTIGVHHFAIIDNEPWDQDDDKNVDPLKFTGELHLWTQSNDCTDEPCWKEIQPSIQNDSTDKDQELFGTCLSISDANKELMVAVGIPHVADNAPGRVQVYRYINKDNLNSFEQGQWDMVGSPIMGDNALFGGNVALSKDGTILSVLDGFPTTDPNEPGVLACSILVFQFSDKDDDWVQLGKDLKSDDKDNLTCTTMEQSADGKTVAVGGRIADPGCPEVPKPAGHVRVWSYDDASQSWKQKGSDLDTLIPLISPEEDFDIGLDINLSEDGSKITVSVTEGIPGAFLFYHSYVLTFEWDDEESQWVKHGGPLSVTKELTFSSSMSDDGKTLVTTYQDYAIRQGIVDAYTWWSDVVEEEENPKDNTAAA